MRLVEPGGEPWQLTNMAHGASGGEWSPNGALIAFLSPLNESERLNTHDAEDSEESKPLDLLAKRHVRERDEQNEKERLDPYVMNRIPYRAGTRFLGDRYQQLHVVESLESR